MSPKGTPDLIAEWTPERVRAFLAQPTMPDGMWGYRAMLRDLLAAYDAAALGQATSGGIARGDDAGAFAEAFHEAYERLAPAFGYVTRQETAVPWDKLPDANRRLMEAVVTEVVSPILREVAARFFAIEREVASDPENRWCRNALILAREGRRRADAMSQAPALAVEASHPLRVVEADAACGCGHLARQHHSPGGGWAGYGDECQQPGCSCREFTHARGADGEPSVRTPESLDAFLTAAIKEFDAVDSAERLTASLPALRVAIGKLRAAQTISRELLARRVGPAHAKTWDAALQSAAEPSPQASQIRGPLRGAPAMNADDATLGPFRLECEQACVFHCTPSEPGVRAVTLNDNATLALVRDIVNTVTQYEHQESCGYAMDGPPALCWCRGLYEEVAAVLQSAAARSERSEANQGGETPGTEPA
jgi:hypothetical protein